MHVYILGGGPAGLAIAHGLSLWSDLSFTVLEGRSSPGGLAQTLEWGENGFHDLGPHKIFTLDQVLMERIEALLSPEEWLTRTKASCIYIRGHYLRYPPSPFSLAHVYGIPAFIHMISGYGLARLRALFGSRTPATFEEDIVHRLGWKLYEALFKPIASKLWGHPAHLDAKLSKGRVQTPSLWEILGRLVKLRRSSDFEALDFRYPRGGLQKLWESILAQTQTQGCCLLNCMVTGVEARGKRIHKICCQNHRTQEKEEIQVQADDFVFSTLPLVKLSKLVTGFGSEGFADLIRKYVVLNDLLLIFLKIDQTRLLDVSWIFVPDPDIAFHRVSEQAAFDPDMTSGGSIVCCEIMSNENRRMAELTDNALIDLAKQGLEQMGYKGFTVLDQRVIRLPESYPVYQTGFEQSLKSILYEWDQLANFRTVGRQGAFSYIGTLDAMDIGYGAARWFIDSDTTSRENDWQIERERTRYYPVLD